MYIRCGKCGRPSRILGREACACPECGAAWPRVGPVRDSATDEHERFRTADEFARIWRIDLASAYSVLAGVMTLEDAVQFQQQDDRLLYASPSAREAAVRGEAPPLLSRGPSAATPPGPATVGWVRGVDPAFRPSIDAGRLTERQARERGDRVAYASRLAQQHGMSMHDAFLVADNLVSLPLLLGKKELPPPEVATVAPQPAGTSRRILLAIVAVAAAIVLVVAWSARPRSDGRSAPASAGVPRAVPPPSPSPSTETPSVEIRNDLSGAITQITGPDPDVVLAAFCSAARQVRREPVRVDRSGVFATGFFREGSSLLGVAIRKNLVDGTWQAGNGVQPIEGTRPGRATEPQAPR